MFHYSTLFCVHSFGRKDVGPYYPQGPFCPTRRGRCIGGGVRACVCACVRACVRMCGSVLIPVRGDVHN